MIEAGLFFKGFGPKTATIVLSEFKRRRFRVIRILMFLIIKKWKEFGCCVNLFRSGHKPQEGD